MSQKELKDLIRDIRRNGYEVTHERGGHYKVRKGGKTVYTLPGTPSGGRWKRLSPIFSRNISAGRDLH